MGSGELGSAASRRGSGELLGLVWRYPYLHSRGLLPPNLRWERPSIFLFLCIVFDRSSSIGSHLIVIFFVDGFPFDVHICGWVPL